MFIRITDQQYNYGEQIINTDMITTIILKNGHYRVNLCDDRGEILVSYEDAQKIFREIGTSI